MSGRNLSGQVTFLNPAENARQPALNGPTLSISRAGSADAWTVDPDVYYPTIVTSLDGDAGVLSSSVSINDLSEVINQALGEATIA
jgi:hypothetical protein